MSSIVDDEPSTPTAASLMGSTRTAASTAATSPPTSPRRESQGDEGKLRAELKIALEAKSAAESRASVLEAELGRFKDQFTFANAAKEALESQLREEVKRREQAEEKVELLRGQVEQARRGVMQLQKQDADRAARRQSVQFEPEKSSSEPTPAQKKRQSLYIGSRRPVSAHEDTEKKDDKPASGLRQLTLGSGAAGHGRNKSMSLRAPPPVNVSDLPSSPRRVPPSPRSPRYSPPSTSPLRTSEDGKDDEEPIKGVSPTEESISLATPASPLRPSAQSVQSAQSVLSTATTTSATSQNLPVTNEHIEQLKSARVETAALRAHIEALEMKLAEADEAREASEDCLRALREFLAADPAAGAGTVSLPPMPHEMDDDPSLQEVEVQEKKGWGFGGLWRADQSPPPETGNKAIQPRRGSTSSTSPSIAVSPPPAIAEVLASVPENLEDKAKTSDKADKDKELPKAPASGWLGGWRATTTAPSPPPEEPVVSPPAEEASQGANLGRSLTSFFGRRARAASREAAKAEADKADADAEDMKEHDDAPLASAVAAAAAAETSELGLQFNRIPQSESEGSPKTLAARADAASRIDALEKSSTDAPAPSAGANDAASRVAAAKAKAEAMALERAERRRARVAERMSRKEEVKTADEILGSPKDEKKGEEDEGLAYLSSPAKPSLALQTEPAVIEPASESITASVMSPPSATSTKSNSVAFDSATATAPSPARSPSLPSHSPSTPVPRPRRGSSLSSPISPVLSTRASPRPESALDDEREELADTTEADEDKPVAGVPKRPQRRNASKRGRGGAKATRGNGRAARGGFV